MVLKKLLRQLALVAGFAAFATAANASQTPLFDTFGALPNGTPVTFNPSGANTGIPVTAVAQTYFGQGGVLDLSATQRYDSPALTNNGNGRFFALPGIDSHSPSNATHPFGMWNFDYYVHTGGDYTYRLYVDFNPGTDETFTSYLLSLGQNGVLQDSSNLGWWNFPTAGVFDPTINGEYTFMLTANDGDRLVASTSIVVQVGTVPEPESLALVGLGLFGILAARRRKQ